MQRKKFHDKFKDNLLKIDNILKEYNLARLKSYTHPDFSDLRNPEYGEAEFKVLNPAIFEDIMSYANKKAFQHSTQILAKVVENSDRESYTLIFSPTKESIANCSNLEKETEMFLHHMLPAIKDYERRFH